MLAKLVGPQSVITFVLPEPISSNRYWRTHGHITYKTREAKAYCELVATLTASCRTNGGPAFPSGDVAVVLVWHRGRKAGDLDNRSKVLYDALQGSVYADDAQIAEDARKRADASSGHWSLCMPVFDEIPKGHVQIWVTAL